MSICLSDLTIILLVVNLFLAMIKAQSKQESENVSVERFVTSTDDDEMIVIHEHHHHHHHQDDQQDQEQQQQQRHCDIRNEEDIMYLLSTPLVQNILGIVM